MGPMSHSMPLASPHAPLPPFGAPLLLHCPCWGGFSQGKLSARHRAAAPCIRGSPGLSGSDTHPQSSPRCHLQASQDCPARRGGDVPLRPPVEQHTQSCTPSILPRATLGRQGFGTPPSTRGFPGAAPTSLCHLGLVLHAPRCPSVRDPKLQRSGDATTVHPRAHVAKAGTVFLVFSTNSGVGNACPSAQPKSSGLWRAELARGPRLPHTRAHKSRSSVAAVPFGEEQMSHPTSSARSDIDSVLG